MVSGLLVDRAPLSTGNLAHRLDGLRLPNERLVGARRTGHSWCRPHCPVAERTYRAPLTTLSGPIVDVGFALTRAGMARGGHPPVAPNVRDRIDYPARRIRVTAVARYRLDRAGQRDAVVLVVRFAAR